VTTSPEKSIEDTFDSVPEVSAEPEGAMRWLLDGNRTEEPRTVFEVVVDGAATLYENVSLHRVARGVARSSPSTSPSAGSSRSPR
jgi:hypothetical protein